MIICHFRDGKDRYRKYGVIAVHLTGFLNGFLLGLQLKKKRDLVLLIYKVTLFLQGSQKMKIMTFNTQHCLNFLERKIDFQIMADTIRQCDADIVGLNEMRDLGEHPEFDSQTKILSKLSGLPHWYFAKAIDVNGNNPYGNGLLSRYPIVQAETVLIPDPIEKKPNAYYETRCILKAGLENGLTVLIVHFGLNPEEQQNAVDVVLQHLEDEKCILMGDFNASPEDAVIDPIRAKMKDTAALFATPLLSFPSDYPVAKIDYIFVSEDILVTQADIPAIIASDHRPHTAQIKL